MSDQRHIFISYKREDSDMANAVRLALRSVGFEVWWDEALQTGERWEERIDKALMTAEAVVVLWTKASVGSDWVRHEASVAKIREVLTHAVLDDVEIPGPFEAIQAANLVGWDRREDHPQFQKLVASIRHIGQTRAERAKAAEAAIAKEAEKREAAEADAAAALAREKERFELAELKSKQTLSRAGRRMVAAAIAAFALGAAAGGFGGWRYFEANQSAMLSHEVNVGSAVDPRANFPGPPDQDTLREVIRTAERDAVERLRSLIKEYKLAARVVTWPGERADPDAVYAEVMAGFRESSLMGRERVAEVLGDVKEAYLGRTVEQSPEAQVRILLAPLLREISLTAYEDAIYDYAPELPSALIYTEASNAGESDRLNLVRLLSHGPNPSFAVPFLEGWISETTSPNPEVVGIARSVLGRDFETWFEYTLGRSAPRP